MIDEDKEPLISSSSFSQSYDQKSDASHDRFVSDPDERRRNIGFFGLVSLKDFLNPMNYLVFIRLVHKKVLFQFRYASTWDKFLILCGTLFSVVHGAGWPVLSIIFGQMTNTFLRAENSDFSQPSNLTGSSNSSIPPISTEEFLDKVAEFSLYYALIGFAMFIASYAQVQSNF